MDLQIKNEENQMLKIFLLTLQIPFFFLIIQIMQQSLLNSERELGGFAYFLPV